MMRGEADLSCIANGMHEAVSRVNQPMAEHHARSTVRFMTRSQLCYALKTHQRADARLLGGRVKPGHGGKGRQRMQRWTAVQKARCSEAPGETRWKTQDRNSTNSSSYRRPACSAISTSARAMSFAVIYFGGTAGMVRAGAALYVRSSSFR